MMVTSRRNDDVQSLLENPSCRVVVVILNWNGEQYLESCLRSVFGQEYQDFTVILVDNGSTDGSLHLVRTRFPQVHIIENRENQGFATANNQAIRASASEFVATLNNDTEVKPGWLGALVQAMDTDSRVGMCASKMMLADRREVVESAGIAVDRTGISWGRQEGNADYPGKVIPYFVFGPCAGAALYRRTMLDEIGLFDQDFFAYLEDVDLAWRAQWADWKCAYVPKAVVYHIHSATGKEGSSFKNKLLGRNKIWTLCKNYPSPSFLWYAPLILAYDLMAATYAIATGHRGAIRGRIAALFKIPVMLSKRRQVIRRISPQTMMARLYPVENPLAILRRYAHIRTVSSLQ
jgi:GT2 family glycosyltransferase